jgi:transposase
LLERAMFLPDRHSLRIFLHRAPVDMRKQRNGLAAIAREVLAEDPFSGALVCYIGKGRDKLKILYWDRNGFAVWYKVIEGKEKFHWPRRTEDASITLTADQLEWLLDGYDVWKMKPHRALKFSHIS